MLSKTNQRHPTACASRPASMTQKVAARVPSDIAVVREALRLAGAHDLPMTSDDIVKYDERRTAIHEAGHLTVACAEGVDRCALILPNPTSDPSLWKSWIGQVEGFSATTPALSIAGLVADRLVECGEDDEDYIYEGVSNAVWFDEVSPTDLAGLPPLDSKMFNKAIGKALRLIRENQRFFRWAINDLLDSHHIPDGLAADVFRDMKELRGRARPKPGHCLTCGYDLRAKERCPRCGTPSPAQMVG